jgi:hypothetical protein
MPLSGSASSLESNRVPCELIASFADKSETA